MVANGWAVAYRRYSNDYVAMEQSARVRGAGQWSGAFVMPWDWRRGQRLETRGVTDDGECRIKGNIGRNGRRIYHMPGSRWYARTKIDKIKGERWFCTEDEARTVGWLPSSR